MNKKIFLPLLLALSMLALLSCERKYDAPLLQEPKLSGEWTKPAMPIAEFKKLYNGLGDNDKAIIEQDILLKGVVVANDISGSLYKKIHIQDETGGLPISIDTYNLSSEFPVGQTLVIRAKGLGAVKFRGLLQLGLYEEQKEGEKENTRLSLEQFKEVTQREGWPNLELAKPIPTTIDKLNDYVGCIVLLEDIYFVDGGKEPFAPKEGNANRRIKDKQGNNATFRMSGYSQFTNDILPVGYGNVIAVVSWYGNAPQLELRQKEDLFGFDGKSPETPKPDKPKEPEKPAPGASIIFKPDFAKGMEGFTEQSIKGDAKWSVDTQFKNMKMSGFKKGENEDWCISPAFDLSTAKSASLTFTHVMNFAPAERIKQDHTLLFSSDFTGDVSKATWTKVEIPKYPAGNSWKEYVQVNDLAFPATVLGKSKVHFAFKYYCTADKAATWQISKLSVKSDSGKVIK